MTVATPNWGTEFTLSRAYLADRATGATLMTIPGGHSIDALCFCLVEFKEASSVVATQRKQIRIVQTGEMIPMMSPDQVLVSGVLESGATASVHVKGGTANGTGLLAEIHGSEGDIVRHEEGIAQIQEGLAGSRATGAEPGRPRDFCLLAKACMLETGRLDAGLSAFTEALVVAEEHEIRNYAADSSAQRRVTGEARTLKYRGSSELLSARD
jgi:predicted dehydrogenase